MSEITINRPHAVVIGSGLGGLAAAIRLGARGYRVTVLEQCGRRFSDDVELKSLHPFYRIRFFNGEVLDCSADDVQMAEQINRFAPAASNRVAAPSRRS